MAWGITHPGTAAGWLLINGVGGSVVGATGVGVWPEAATAVKVTGSGVATAEESVVGSRMADKAWAVHGRVACDTVSTASVTSRNSCSALLC